MVEFLCVGKNHSLRSDLDAIVRPNMRAGVPLRVRNDKMEKRRGRRHAHNFDNTCTCWWKNIDKLKFKYRNGGGMELFRTFGI